MQILFLTLVDIDSIYSTGIYADLIRKLDAEGHRVSVISPVEKRSGKPTGMIREHNTRILKLRIGNTQKTNIIEKGISTVMIEPTFKRAIRKYFSDVRFDLILYSTPPITLVSAIAYAKKRDGARTYLLLKDIFPQNAVDLGMLSVTGAKGFLYRHFRRQEKKLYELSDRIGCMSRANVEYVRAHDPEVDPEIVEICPNCIDVADKSVDEDTKIAIRAKYGIPNDKKVFVYGGNLGRPQGIPFLIECLRQCRDMSDAFFLIVGDGTEYGLLEDFAASSKQTNMKLMRRIPKEDYDAMVGACDVGLIFLDHRFTIPNFPSRLLSYMAAKMPVLACTDPNTDVGKTIEDGGFGFWCESDDVGRFAALIERIGAMRGDELAQLGERAFEYLTLHFNVESACRRITAD